MPDITIIIKDVATSMRRKSRVCLKEAIAMLKKALNLWKKKGKDIDEENEEDIVNRTNTNDYSVMGAPRNKFRT